jgi:hypothetical protein
MARTDKISIDLLPHERAVLRQRTYPCADLKSQLNSFRSSAGIETVTISSLLPGPADWRPDSRHRQARLS